MAKKRGFNLTLFIFLIVLVTVLCGIFYFRWSEGEAQIENLVDRKRSEDNIVFIIPSTSRNMNYEDVESCSLVSTLYASLKKFDISRYTFVVGTDDDDAFYNENIDTLKENMPDNFKFHVLNNFDKSYVCIVNQLADIAVTTYDADYIYVFADDLDVYDLTFIDAKFLPYFKDNGDA